MLTRIIYVLFGIIIFFIPGYLVNAIIYPEPKDMDILKRIGSSIGLSALIITLIIIILAHIGELKLIPFVIAVLIFCISCIAIQIYIYKGVTGLIKLLRQLKTRKSIKDTTPGKEEENSDV